MVIIVGSKESFPLQYKCLTPNIVYRDDVRKSTNDKKKIYLEVIEKAFKERFSNHTRDLKHLKHRYSTELSRYI